MNAAKTELMVCRKERENINIVKTHNNQLKQTEVFKYLGSTLTEKGSCQAEVGLGKCSVVQMEGADTSHLRQEDIGKTEGEGVQEHGETGASVRRRDVGDERD